MNTKEEVSISGSCIKLGPVWVAHIPLLRVNSHGLSPSSCLESLKRTILEIIDSEVFEFELKVSDEGLLLISTENTDVLRNLINKRSEATSCIKTMMKIFK